ncbi:3-oxoacid CoA-transferase subunit A [Clostridium botulinum]|uniref:3-oxoacid CoA-transferase, A subunit n=1 Tax=Clostridium botulinum (strain Eklund 17B / Type B) TaxID=935198 RepID=B2TLN6_CLOBB|nr:MULTISPECIES: 3-oxoacid CoA-transferase subunit A [unclassified Clostridium]ACD23784.1 3-oxoacid CoA-transferase, A subunit [Clostridium botulinum B str. Eklund 17B (NRP)]MBN1038863.1 3-oxoacid CoA-transferase subunit A [Clostridium botulinum]MBY6976921.1 3-oxoacid CoA-transferase subunit A [Clostridium botulinum]MBY7002101.1 3-oxoacid CoA-transferase subunit A [Clostridium botulinum]MBZ9691893.1 3-oxoacid CoA-transferase subunit A [Clostridium sp. M14]
MNKIVKLEDLKSIFKDGMTIMIGGFLDCGSPETIIDMLVNLNVKNLTIIGNDTGYPDKGIGKLVVNGQVKKVIASHIGTNPETGRRMNSGEMEVELSPQGTLIERIRAAGSGLGGVLTSTGIGTIVEKGKRKILIDDKEYLLELPLKADVSLVKGSIVDEFGNTCYKGTTKNFNPYIAMAADTVIMEAENLVEFEELNREDIMTPGVLVNYIIREEI